jgi:hypothetical protein
METRGGTRETDTDSRPCNRITVPTSIVLWNIVDQIAEIRATTEDYGNSVRMGVGRGQLLGCIPYTAIQKSPKNVAERRNQCQFCCTTHCPPSPHPLPVLSERPRSQSAIVNLANVISDHTICHVDIIRVVATVIVGIRSHGGSLRKRLFSYSTLVIKPKDSALALYKMTLLSIYGTSLNKRQFHSHSPPFLQKWEGWFCFEINKSTRWLFDGVKMGWKMSVS